MGKLRYRVLQPRPDDRLPPRMGGPPVSPIVVVSTAHNAPTRGKCIESVRGQTVEAFHIYIDAAEQRPPKPALENVVDAIGPLDPEAIVVWLDGDDWLAGEGSLAAVAKLYCNPNVWLSYGSYRCADGRPGCSRPYETEDYRREPWKASHLKTFKAWLFQAIPDCELRDGGRADAPYRSLVVDQAAMLPMLEMAGPEHSRFVPEILSVYNYASSYEHRANVDMLVAEQAAVREIRNRKPLARLEEV